MATATKKETKRRRKEKKRKEKKRKEAYPWKAGARSRHTTSL
jgi:hypothetical protein